MNQFTGIGQQNNAQKGNTFQESEILKKSEVDISIRKKINMFISFRTLSIIKVITLFSTKSRTYYHEYKIL